MDSDRRKNKAYLSLGSNLGDRNKNLHQAIELIGEKLGKIVAKSSVYQSESWGNEELPVFLNMVILLETDLGASGLMHQLLDVETEMGRQRNKDNNYISRIVDIDIIYFNDCIISQKDLEIPHPHMHKRNFVLMPLAEISPDFIHPILKKSNSKLLEISPDELKCNRTF